MKYIPQNSRLLCCVAGFDALGMAVAPLVVRDWESAFLPTIFFIVAGIPFYLLLFKQEVKLGWRPFDLWPPVFIALFSAPILLTGEMPIGTKLWIWLCVTTLLWRFVIFSRAMLRR